MTSLSRHSEGSRFVTGKRARAGTPKPGRRLRSRRAKCRLLSPVKRLRKPSAEAAAVPKNPALRRGVSAKHRSARLRGIRGRAPLAQSAKVPGRLLFPRRAVAKLGYRARPGGTRALAPIHSTPDFLPG